MDVRARAGVHADGTRGKPRARGFEIEREDEDEDEDAGWWTESGLDDRRRAMHVDE